MSEEGRWIRRATEVEVLFDDAHKAGLLITVYDLTLNTKVPLQDHQVQEAFHHLYRKVPTLRLCLRPREEDDALWFCDMDSHRMDVQVESECDSVKVMEALLQYRFKTTEGPLWCARLLPPGSGHDSLSLPQYPHSRTIVFANHHSIADGTSNAMMIDLFLQILDRVIVGETVDDNVQLGELTTGEELNSLTLAKEAELESDPDHLKSLMKVKTEHEEAEKLISMAFPRPTQVEHQTRILPVTLNKEMSKNFFRKCKAQGVTVNSGFTALLNGSLVDIVAGAGVKQDDYMIRELHSVNCRRYYSGDCSRILGTNISLLPNNTLTSIHWHENFWNYAKVIQDQFTKSLQEQAPLEFLCLSHEHTNDSTEDPMTVPDTARTDIDTANLGNLDSLIPTEGDHVRLTNVIRATCVWSCPVVFMFHSLRGHFTCSLCYDDGAISEDIGKQFLSKILENMKTVI